MKPAPQIDEIVGTRDEVCLRKFLAGNKVAFAQAFWENAKNETELPRENSNSETKPKAASKVAK